MRRGILAGLPVISASGRRLSVDQYFATTGRPNLAFTPGVNMLASVLAFVVVDVMGASVGVQVVLSLRRRRNLFIVGLSSIVAVKTAEHTAPTLGLRLCRN